MANHDSKASEQPADDLEVHLPAVKLSRTALKVAIIETLESRPKHSCKRDDLVKHVLGHLGEDVRGNARKEFAKRLRQAERGLDQSRVVRLYKAKNKRVRLTPDYTIGYQRLKRRLSRENAKPAGDLFGPDVPEATRASPVRIRDLPELPDEVYYDGEDDAAATPESLPTEDEDVPEDDTDHLLEILSSPPPEESDSLPGREGTAGVGAPGGRGVTLVLAELAGLLEAVPGLAVRRVFRELRLSLHVGDHVIAGSVAYLPVNGSLRTRIHLPFVADAAVNLLRLFGQDSFTGTICMANGTCEESYVVRRTICFESHSADEIANMVQQLFVEAIRAKQILRSGQ